jgi:GT2 family glycosyltransferase/glycosyltransferase involved in cell wall biosynthesis
LPLVLTLAVTYTGLLGGAERTLLDFTGGLPGGLVLACPEGALADRARSEGVRVVTMRARPLELRGGVGERVAAGRELAGHAREVRRLVREVRPDLLVAWGMRTAIVAPATAAGLDRRPAVLVRHVDFLPGPSIARLVRAAVARADRVSVNSQAVGRDLDPDGTLGERLSVISPGIDLPAYDAEWEPSPAPEVLLLGTLMPWKRPDLALEAVARAAQSVPRLHLTIAGAPMNSEGERLVAELRRRAARPDLDGRVTFAGELPDPRPALGQAWCLLHCADREPFGNVVLQALASGRPVVAPAAGGPAEIVDESCGRLYPPGDAGAAAAALVEVLNTPGLVDKLGDGGRARAGWFEADEARQRFAELATEAVAEREAAARRGGSGAARGERLGGARGERSRSHAARQGAGMALVTVTHNSAAAVERLLRSAEVHLPGAHVIVADSGSSDGSATAARAAAPRATVVQLGENVGFGRASNAGVALVEEPICVLINPDAELVDGSLAALAADLLAPGAPEQILAPLMLSPDGSRQDTGHLDPASPLLLLKALVPPAALPRRLQPLVDPWRSQRSRRVGWAVAACLVAPTDTLRRLGPFDERIFLFAEDLDLGLRAADAGVDTVFRPDARVVHQDAHSTSAAFDGEPFELLARQRRAVIGELRGQEAARRDDRIWALTYLNRIALKTLTRRPTERERRQLAALRRVRDEPARLGEPSES